MNIARELVVVAKEVVAAERLAIAGVDISDLVRIQDKLAESTKSQNKPLQEQMFAELQKAMSLLVTQCTKAVGNYLRPKKCGFTVDRIDGNVGKDYTNSGASITLGSKDGVRRDDYDKISIVVTSGFGGMGGKANYTLYSNHQTEWELPFKSNNSVDDFMKSVERFAVLYWNRSYDKKPWMSSPEVEW